MNIRLIAATAALSLVPLLPAGMVIAQPHGGHDHTPVSTPALGTPAVTEDLAEGEIRRIDASTGRVTIRHGVIKSLDMPPMTMVFHAAEPGLLNNLKVGDKIRFAAEQQQGKIIVTRIELAP
jgi:Cu/Ag efflux protein CusF